MTIREINKKIALSIDECRDEINFIGEHIKNNPELGYFEVKTSQLVRDTFDKMEIKYEYPCALTGVKASLKGKSDKFNVCIIGEMDALKCAGSPIADNEGTSHSCGHNAQIAAMLGAAMGLVNSGVLDELDGKITFMAVPAEEFIDMEARKELRESKKIRYYGGKQQLISEGAFDDVDIAVMIHAQPCEEKAKLYVRGNNLGFVAKTITFKGKAVHGSTPFDGVNALNAAALSILGIHSNRETFKEEERIRIHPIITKGGDVVNSVPDEVCIDTYVRGATLDAINKGEIATERAVYGAATMVGASVEIEDVPGYLPINESVELSEIMENVAKNLIGTNNIVYGKEITGSSDIGDLSCILPTIQPSIGGFSGQLHSKEFDIADAETAYVTAAKLLAQTVAVLLYDDAAAADNILKKFKPRLTKEQYLNYLERKK